MVSSGIFFMVKLLQYKHYCNGNDSQYRRILKSQFFFQFLKKNITTKQRLLFNYYKFIEVTPSVYLKDSQSFY